VISLVTASEEENSPSLNLAELRFGPKCSLMIFTEEEMNKKVTSKLIEILRHSRLNPCDGVMTFLWKKVEVKRVELLESATQNGWYNTPKTK